ncbi:ketosteroid isomerase-like protein [Paraburkholderia sp. GAS199]|uniref:nuclear transport factor 2 family protein n=1 Tax=Paraburkholderia sp. GAS199 TaxID=3035126 RepID=UPI003D19C8A2
MSSANELIHEFFDCLKHLDTSVDRCVDLFADDGVFEFPYFSTLGMPTRFEGKEALREVLNLIRSRFSSFTVSNVSIHELKDGHGLFTEYHTDGFIDGTERVYAQDYVTRLVEEGGKIKLLREYLNIISTARMMLPNGLADVPAPKSTVE